MYLVPDSGVLYDERQDISLGDLIGRDAARMFRDVVCSRFLSALERLELSVDAVRRRLDDFERQIGAVRLGRSSKVFGAKVSKYFSLATSIGWTRPARTSLTLRAGGSTSSGTIVPLKIERRKHLGIWLSKHLGSGGIPRVRQMIDWLVETFNSTRFPWFKDDFVHSTELKSVYKGESLTQLFGGFSTRTVKAE